MNCSFAWIQKSIDNLCDVIMISYDCEFDIHMSLKYYIFQPRFIFKLWFVLFSCDTRNIFGEKLNLIKRGLDL